MGVELRLSAQPGPLPAPATSAALQFVVRVPGLTAPLEGLLTQPSQPTDRLLVYFLGFNDPLGPWEGAKAALLAEAFGAAVLAVEMPGQSRFGDPIPAAVRRSMIAGHLDAWATLHGRYLEAAREQLGLRPTELDLLGYSTGCSLASAAVSRLEQWAPIRSISLIEPVGAIGRSLARLALDNARDVLRQPPAYAANHRHPWVMDARRRQLREPWTRYGAADLLAITEVLRRDHITEALRASAAIRCTLVRGADSDLCPREAFEALGRAHPSALRVTVQDAGHPLWHSFPVVVGLVRTLAEAAG